MPRDLTPIRRRIAAACAAAACAAFSLFSLFSAACLAVSLAFPSAASAADEAPPTDSPIIFPFDPGLQPVYVDMPTKAAIRDVLGKTASITTCRMQATLRLVSPDGQTLLAADQEILLRRPHQAKIVSRSATQRGESTVLDYLLVTGSPQTFSPKIPGEALSPLGAYEAWMGSGLWGLRQDSPKRLADETIDGEAMYVIDAEHGYGPPLKLRAWIRQSDGQLRKVIQRERLADQKTPGFDELTVRSIETNIETSDSDFRPAP